MFDNHSDPLTRAKGRCERCSAPGGSECLFGKGTAYTLHAIGPNGHRRVFDTPPGRWSEPKRVRLSVVGGVVLCQRCGRQAS